MVTLNLDQLVQIVSQSSSFLYGLLLFTYISSFTIILKELQNNQSIGILAHAVVCQS